MTSFFPLPILLLMLSLLLHLSICQPVDDKVQISKIPQFPKQYSHDIYAGYLSLTQYDKQLYYMLFMSQKQNENDPVILWLNGGPGCSSLIGMATQNGPFLFEPQAQTMKINPYSWNKEANVLYLQSPAGVGFSKGKKDSITANDTSVATDNFLALLQFFEKFPSLKDNDFYIAGESYAGIYIPRLSQQIITNNQQQSTQDQKINLKGIMIGNACTHPTECYTKKYLSRYQIQFLYTRGFIDTSDYSEYLSTCITSNNQKSNACVTLQQNILNSFDTSHANIYNVYGQCYPLTGQSYINSYVTNRREKEKSGQLQFTLKCQDFVGLNKLFNTDQNRPALHVESYESLKWTPCSDAVNSSYSMESRAAFTTLPNLVKYGLKIYYYSGDFDAMVPIQGTIDWLKRYRSDYGASVKKNWRTWSADSGASFAGMVWQLDGISFWSVAGAGHMVPADKPKQAKYLLDLFLGLNEDGDEVAEE